MCMPVTHLEYVQSSGNTWETVLVVALLGVCVLYISRVLYSFREQGLRVTRGEDVQKASDDAADATEHVE